ncbi:MAG: DNA polymerase III subunit delta [Desulfobulbaceae bacterium]|uniref:DNA-directed DNA polymerase n=1 Tax=Candidatus Desulfatifera sulfidica TaxID=2841691 RepID=A0A8J6NC24_9BACT|nr:DNA polymerase III subunit delta [Candidatus Desulfatifera sulfidica]
MTIIKRNELKAGLVELAREGGPQLFLFFGERYLCREAAEQLEAELIRQQGGLVHAVDGDQEDPLRTLGSLMTYSLLPGAQVYRVTDSRLFQSRVKTGDLWNKAEKAQAEGRSGPAQRQLLRLVEVAGFDSQDRLGGLTSSLWKEIFGFAKPAGDLAWADELLADAGPQQVKGGDQATLNDRYLAAFEQGWPTQNILLLISEQVDKRLQLFKGLKKHGLVVDCSVAQGAGAAARRDQDAVLQEMVARTLSFHRKKMASPVLDQLLERVGFHPEAVVMEVEKLALSVEERPQITAEDLDNMIGRTREDALYELTEVFGRGQLDRTLTICHRLLDNGIHALAILATMRNFLRRLLIIRTLQLQPVPRWQSRMQARQFQDQYLPILKEQGEWADLLKGHPYALFMSFSKAEKFSCTQLKGWLARLLSAEYQLKGGPFDQKLVLDELFVALLATGQD